MVIWLRGDASNVGIEADVVRREEMALLTDIDNGFIDLQQHGARLLSAKQQEAAALIEAAECQAEAIMLAAQKKFDQSAKLGYASGYRKASEQLHARMMARMVDDRQALMQMQKRLADIIVRSVQQMTMNDDRNGLYTRAATLVGRELSKASFLRVTIHPSDADKVRSVFTDIGAKMRWPVAAEIIENRDTAPGDCLCEWDYGVFDGSLAVQLQALQRAVNKVLVSKDLQDQHEYDRHVDLDDKITSID